VTDPSAMDAQPRLISINTRLVSEELGLDLDIRLRQLDGRWLAVADFGDEPEVGIGATPRVALAAALATLGERAAAILMADPQLFEASAAIGRSA
jgi:microcystin degradation protein MlrC